MEAIAMATTQEQKLARIEDMGRRIQRVLYWGASRYTASLVHPVALSENFQDDVPRPAIDNYAEVRRRVVEQLGVAPESLITEAGLHGIVDDVGLLIRLCVEVGRLKLGVVDEGAKTQLSRPVEVGAVISLILSGKSDREVTQELRLDSVDLETLFVDGIRYLATLLVNERPGRVEFL